MESLVGIVQALSLARSLEAIQAIVKKAARHLTDADGASFVLREGGNCYYADEDAIAPLWKGRSFPVATCISGWVMEHKQPVFIDDIYQDERIPADAYRPTFVKSLAMIPIRTQQPIGAIGCYWAEHHTTTMEEMKILRALADMVSVAMENVQLYEKLERSHKLFTTFMGNAPFAAFIAARDGTRTYSNPTADALVPTGAVAVGDSMVRDRTGALRHLYALEFPVELTSGEVSVGYIALDVTEQRRAQEQLQLSYKMASLGEMASCIAHEVNNPLTVVMVRAHQLRTALEDQSLDPNFARKAATEIETMATRIATIIKGLRTVSRQADRDPHVETELGAIFDGILALLGARVDAPGVELRVAPFRRDLRLECRPSEISQVLLNLITNAADAVANLAIRWVELSVESDARWVTLCVTDSGSGIPPELHAKIMQPFFTTKEFGKGTGLGLSISQGIIESHCGTLSVDAASPHTRFVVRLPRRQAYA